MIQTVRIPEKENPSLKKVGQYIRKKGNTSIKDYVVNSDCGILLKDILTKKKYFRLGTFA